MRALPFLIPAVLAVAAPLAAQTAHNSNAPIDFGADTIELQDKANRAVLTGNVNVRQARTSLRQLNGQRDKPLAVSEEKRPKRRDAHAGADDLNGRAREVQPHEARKQSCEVGFDVVQPRIV